MGNDGGSIPDRRDLVRNKPKAEQADRENQIKARWFFCALSKRPLQEPIVSCALGKLYNKDAIIEYLLDKTIYGDGEEICGHIKSLKDIKTLKLTPNPVASDTKFACPLTLKGMSGSLPFVYLVPCGCVFSSAGLRAVELPQVVANPELSETACPQCGKPYNKSTDVRLLNPPLEEAEKMRAVMEAQAAQAKINGGVAKSKKRKVVTGDATPTGAESKRARHSSQPPTQQSIMTVSRTVIDSLAAEEKKRKDGMSSVVASLYKPKNGVPEKESFMTRTFNRYA